MTMYYFNLYKWAWQYIKFYWLFMSIWFSNLIQDVLKSLSDYQEAISSTIKLNDEGLVIGLLEFLQNDKKIKVNIEQHYPEKLTTNLPCKSGHFLYLSHGSYKKRISDILLLSNYLLTHWLGFLLTADRLTIEWDTSISKK